MLWIDKLFGKLDQTPIIETESTYTWREEGSHNFISMKFMLKFCLIINKALNKSKQQLRQSTIRCTVKSGSNNFCFLPIPSIFQFFHVSVAHLSATDIDPGRAGCCYHGYWKLGRSRHASCASPPTSPLRHSLGTRVVISGYSNTRLQRKRYQRIFTHLPTNIFVFFLTGKRKWLLKRRNFNTDKKQMKRPEAHLSTVILYVRWYLIDLPIINGSVIY